MGCQDLYSSKIKLLSFIMLFNIFISSGFVLGQFEGYQMTNGPYGCRINKITISASDNIYLSTSWKGVFRSNDSGKSWDNLGLLNEDISDIVIDSKGILYTLLDDYWSHSKQRAGIFRSTDNGKTWDLMNFGISDPVVRAITIDNNDNIYVGTGKGGIFFSSDSAATWKTTGLEDKFVRTLNTDNNGWVYAALDGYGIFRRKSSDQPWERLGKLTFAKCQDICVSRTGTIYVALGGYSPFVGMGVYKSDDGGETWIETNNGIDDYSIRTICEDGKGNLFAGATNGRVFRSKDFGNSWDLITIGMTASSVTSLRSNSQNEIYLGTLGSGLYVSSDEGNNWSFDGPKISLAINGVAEFNNKLYCSTNPGVYLSNDYGKSWTGISNGLSPNDLTGLVMTDSTNIFIGTWGGGVFHSANAGKSWTRIAEVNNEATVSFIERSKKSNSIFFGVIGLDHGLYKSGNNGESWEKLLNLEKPNSILIRDDGDIFVGTWDIYYSPNDGINWRRIKKGVSYISCLAVDSTNMILAGSMDGFLYSSGNYGESWDEQYFPIYSFTSLNVMQNGNIVASTYDQGSYISNNNGKDWERISDSWLYKNKILKYVCENKSTYICTNGGIYYKNNLLLDAENHGTSILQNVELFNAFPNPFNPTTKISFSIPEYSEVALKIFDIQGKEITTLIDSRLESGIHSVNFDGSKYASGIYFYTLVTPNFSQTKKFILMK